MSALVLPSNGRAIFTITDNTWRYGEIDRVTGGFGGSNGGGAVPTGALGKSAMAVDPSGRFIYVTIATNRARSRSTPSRATTPPATFCS